MEATKLKAFIDKYGTWTASEIIRRLVRRQEGTSSPAYTEIALEMSTLLEDALEEIVYSDKGKVIVYSDEGK